MTATPLLLESEVDGVHDHVAFPDSDDEQIASTRTWRAARAFRGFMDALNLDAGDPHLDGTDLRVAKAYAELFRGLSPENEPEMRTFPNEEGYSAAVSLTHVPFFSLCAHHFLPFFGEAHVGYLPGGRVVGLSKLARAVDYIARRPQVQERMTEQIAAFLAERLAPRGVIVVVRARHLCMEMRGVRSAGFTTTTAVRGVFTDPREQAAFLAQLPPQ